MFHAGCNIFETATLILDGLPMGILFCDRDGIIRFINRAYASLLDIEPQSALGNHIKSFIPGSRAAVVMENGKPEMGELCQLTPGKGKPVVVNRLPVRNANGAVAGMISQAIFNDPEELQKLSIKIEQLGRSLSHYKKRFAASLAPQHTFASILGDSQELSRLKRQAQIYAALDEPVLILGPTGSGKELFAHAMHAASSRAQGPLVCINCAAIPKDLFESELFGYANGAFSGARHEGKIGQMELADKGTLFLDEIGEMPPEFQVKLLRVLESRQIHKLGSVTAKNVDFRLLAATNRNIDAMLRNGSFREDLYYRINTFVLEIPPLCQRKDDILPIARYVLHRMEYDDVRFSDEAEAAMREFSWPGNVRQLHNAVVHAATMRSGNTIEISDFPPETLPSMGFHAEIPENGISGNSLGSVAANAEMQAIDKALRESNGNVAAAARNLGISRATMYDKMKKFGLDPGSRRH